MAAEKFTTFWELQTLDFFGKLIPVNLPDGMTLEELEGWIPFVNWKTTLHGSLARQEDPDHVFHEHPYRLRKITVQSFDRAGTSIGFVKIDAIIQRDELQGDEDDSQDLTPASPTPGTFLTGTAFLRGHSVAVLMVLRHSHDERYVVLTEQPRIAAGSLAFLEIPGGTIENQNVRFSAAREIEEATGFNIPTDELVNMSELALQTSEDGETNLQQAMYPSPGGCDESIALFLWEKDMDRLEIDGLRGKLTGLRKEDEMITLHIKPFKDLWMVAARDAKTLAALALYEGLNQSGILEEYMQERKSASRHW